MVIKRKRLKKKRMRMEERMPTEARATVVEARLSLTYPSDSVDSDVNKEKAPHGTGNGNEWANCVTRRGLKFRTERMPLLFQTQLWPPCPVRKESRQKRVSKRCLNEGKRCLSRYTASIVVGLLSLSKPTCCRSAFAHLYARPFLTDRL